MVMRSARWILILGLIALLIVGVAATVIVVKKKPGRDFSASDEVPGTTSGIAPTPVVAGTDGWRDYRNLSHNYSLRYPADWLATEVLPSDEGALSEVVINSPVQQTVVVTVFDNPYGLDNKQMADRFVASSAASELERFDIKIDGFDGEKITSLEGFGQLVLTKGSWTYRIRLSPYVLGDANEGVYEKILDTFQFI